MANEKLQYIANGDTLTITLVSADDELLRTMTISNGEVPDEVANGDESVSLKLYGIRKVLQERSSSATESLEAKFDTMLDTAELLKAGKWKSDEVRARAAVIDPTFALAVATLKNASMAQAVAALQALDKGARDALRRNPAIVAEIERIQAEAADAQILDLSI